MGIKICTFSKFMLILLLFVENMSKFVIILIRTFTWKKKVIKNAAYYEQAYMAIKFLYVPVS